MVASAALAGATGKAKSATTRARNDRRVVMTPFPFRDSSLAITMPRGRTLCLVSAREQLRGQSRAKKRRNPMKLSARNILKGRVVDVTLGQTTAHVRLDIGGGVLVTSSITNEAIADLKLKAGDTAYAVIKASDVMIGKE